jgi:hypothetical protein
MSPTKISIIPTSNASILKFEADRFLTNHNSFEFNNIDDSKHSPLAQQLFHLPFVKKVYIASNFVAIERYDIVAWKDVQEEVATQIEDYLSNDGIVITEEAMKPKAAVTIYAESTPNPSVLKFVSNKVLVPNLYEFKSIEEAKPSPLATALFQFPFVKNIFMEKNFISITKFDIIEWEEITLQLREFIKSFVEELILEIKNELSSSFTEDDITKIFIALKNLKKHQPLDKADLITEFSKVHLEYDKEIALLLLFEYSIIGNIDNEEYSATKIYFKHREKRNEPCVLNFDLKFIYHKAIEEYLDKREK